MIPKLYAHQKKIIDDDRKYVGLFLGTGASKTRTALEMAEGRTLVICPKQQRDDKTWERNAEKFDIFVHLTVISKEDLKKQWESLPAFDTIICDEVHTMLGVTPDTRQRKGIQIPKTSQTFDALLGLMLKQKPKRFIPCSATPISKPMNLWALAKLFGKNWSFFDFRNVYYIERRMGFRRIFIPRTDKATLDRLANALQQFGYTGSLNDFFDVPEQTHREVHIDLTGEQKDAIKEISKQEADPMVRRARIRTIENGILYGKELTSEDGKTYVATNNVTLYGNNKIEYILERAQEFKKILIFANYTAQINAIADALKKAGHNVSMLTGATKDRGAVIEEAEKAENAIVIAQSSISSGYELPSFPCVIFASKSYKYVDYEQGIGRVLRSNALKKNLYIHLIVKGVDEDCHKAIMSGKDFAERLTYNI